MKTKKVQAGFIILIIFSFLSGCTTMDEAQNSSEISKFQDEYNMEEGEMPELSKADKEEAIYVALENPEVQIYTSGEYEIIDVSYSVLTRVYEGVESSEQLPAVTIVTKEAFVMVFVDPEKKCVVSIAKNYIRNPVTGPPADDAETPDLTGFVTPTTPKATPTSASNIIR